MFFNALFVESERSLSATISLRGGSRMASRLPGSCNTAEDENGVERYAQQANLSIAICLQVVQLCIRRINIDQFIV